MNFRSMEENICNKIKQYHSRLPENAILVAVSKTKPVETILEAYRCGHRHFGENKVQELRNKVPALPDDIHWHMIGHLQRNKVKYIAPYIWLIHSVDNEKLLREIDKQAAKYNRKIPFLFQIKIAKEETKFGLTQQDYEQLLEKYLQGEFPHTYLKGLMGMATNTMDKQVVRDEFRYLKKLFDVLKKQVDSVEYLSAGMTQDWQIALEEGANIIRIGSGIFGKRN